MPVNQHVILLHGLARTHRSMSPLTKALEKAGYQVINQGYPSTRFPVEELSPNAINNALNQCSGASTIHFVTHSMGGILLRYYLSKFPLENLGRTVMLAPPNHGSEIVDKLKRLPGFKLWNGPAGTQLGTDESSLPKRLGHADFDLGIIAGTRSMSPLLSSLLPKPDDGKVSLASTKLEGMQDHLSLPVTHTFMMQNAEVIQQVKHYLAEGRFKK